MFNITDRLNHRVIDKRAVMNEGPSSKGKVKIQMLQETKSRLDDFYRPFNEQLVDLLLDTKYLWTSD